MAKKINFHWNVWVWDINHDDLKSYDVGEYFVTAYKAIKKAKRPVTRDEVNDFLRKEASYNFWSKCEYELIIHAWPKFKNTCKVDVYDQLQLNWDLFVDMFYNAIKS